MKPAIFWRYWAIFAASLAVAVILIPISPSAALSPLRPLVAPDIPGAVVPPDLSAALQVLADSPLFGKPLVKTEDEAPPNWRLSGTFQSGGAWRVLLSFENEKRPSQELKSGDLLPSGDKIYSIDHEGICVLIGKSKKPRRLSAGTVRVLIH